MMLVLRHPRTWLVIGWLFALTVTLLSLMPMQSLPTVAVSDKLEHTLAYVALTLWFTGIYPRSRYLHIATAMLLLGAAIEYAQGAMHLGRQRDYHDLIANSAGIGLGLLIARIGLGGWAQWVEAWARRR